MRLPPSQVGYSMSSGKEGSGVEVGSGALCCSPITGVLSGFTAGPSQLADGIPGSEVSRQQTVKARTDWNSPNAKNRAMPQSMIQRKGNPWRLSFGMRCLQNSILSLTVTPWTILSFPAMRSSAQSHIL